MSIVIGSAVIVWVIAIIVLGIKLFDALEDEKRFSPIGSTVGATLLAPVALLLITAMSLWLLSPIIELANPGCIAKIVAAFIGT